MKQRRLDIQGLRAVAVLLVVAFHAGLPLPGGFVGVDVFFVISGFVITAMLEREWGESGRIDLVRFYVRRFRRLTPALALAVSVTVLLAAPLASPLGGQTTAALTALGAMSFCANLVIARTTGGYFDGPAETNPLLNTWSLSVEEQFYFLFPMLLTASWRASGRIGRSAAFTVVAVVSAASFAFVFAGASLPGAGTLFGFYSPVTRTWEFGTGALLALSGTRLVGPAASGAAVVGSALVLGSAVSFSGSTPFPGIATVVPVAGTSLLLVGGADATQPIARWLASPAGVRLGDWSYSIYLWHWPMIVFAGAIWPESTLAQPMAAALSFVPAVLSFNLVEEPIRATDVGGRRLAGLVVATVGTPGLSAFALLLGTWWLRTIPSVAAAYAALSTHHLPSSKGCLSRGPYGPELAAQCWWNEGAPGRPVYLVGDSDAWQLAEGVVAAAVEVGRPVWTVTAHSCPLIAELSIEPRGNSAHFAGPWPPREFAHCADYARFALTWLDDAPAGLVIVSNLDQYWWDESLAVSVGARPSTRSSTEKADYYRIGLRATVERLRARGHQVLMVYSVPTFRNPAPLWDPRACTTLDVVRGGCRRELSVETIDQYQASSRAALASVAADTSVELLDLRPSLCPGDVCSTVRGDRWLYMDATHLTAEASGLLAPQFRAALSSRPLGSVSPAR